MRLRTSEALRWYCPMWCTACAQHTRWLHRTCLARAATNLHELLDLPPSAPFAEVRRRYLERAKATHPDSCQLGEGDANFVELQGAWDAYEMAQPRHASDRHGGSFTRFGVGCSWTDDIFERAERAEVMDAASRGQTLRRPIGET